MGIMIFMLKSQRRAFRWPNNLCARLYIRPTLYSPKFSHSTGNLKQTWALINELNQRQKYRTANLNEDIPKHHIGSENFTKFFPKSEQSSLFLNDTEVNEVLLLKISLKNSVTINQVISPSLLSNTVRQ